MGANADSDPDSDPGSDSSLAALIREADERGEAEARLIERVRESYDRDVPSRRVRRLLAAERERLAHLDRIDRVGSEPAVEDHAPRYVESEDLTFLTDAEFARVIAYLLGEREGHAEVLSDASGNADTTEITEATEAAEESVESNGGDEDPMEATTTEADGVPLRWHREEGVIALRALAAEPGRLVDGQLVTRANECFERGQVGRPGVKASPERALLTVADVTPGAARLAVRLDVTLYDRADVRRWLEATRLTPEAFGSLLEAE